LGAQLLRKIIKLSEWEENNSEQGGGGENTHMEDIPRTNTNFINSSDLPSTIQSLYTSCLKRINLVKIQIARKSIG